MVNNNEYPRVITYINIWLIQLYFSLRKKIINNRNLNLILFSNDSIIFFIINIYSDEQQSTLEYIKDIKANLNNILTFTRNFNIRDKDWDLSYSYHSVHTDLLMDIIDSFDLRLSTPIIHVATWYADNPNGSNSVINLMFLWANSLEIEKHSILPNICSFLDYAPITVDIIIEKKFI